MGVRVVVQAERAHRRARLAAADGRLEVEQLARLRLARDLGVHQGLDRVVAVGHAQHRRGVEVLQHHVVVDGHVAGSLVGHVHIVPLRDQADEGAAHRDHVVIRVRREDQHGLGERCGRDRTRAVVRVGLAARPAGDRMLQVVEDPDVDLVVGAVQLQQFAQGVLQIVALCQLEDRRADRLAEPDHGLADELLRPVAGAHQPGGHHAGQQAAGRRVDVEMDMVVPLQQRGRTGGRHLAFDDGLDRLGLVFSPRHQDDAARREHRGDAHRDGALRRGRQVVAEVARLALAGAVGEPHGAGARLLVAASFVEADLPLFADADDQQVQPARELVERGAVPGAPRGGGGCGSAARPTRTGSIRRSRPPRRSGRTPDPPGSGAAAPHRAGPA